MSGERPKVYVVDDDESVRRSFSRLLRSAGYGVEEFSSANEFLRASRPDVPGCVVLDVHMPGLSGLDLQEALSVSGRPLPVVFITGFGDIPTSVKAMKAGAVDFLAKPVDSGTLLAAIGAALELDARWRRERREHEALNAKLGTLSLRERQVFALVTDGRLNKQAAAKLGITEKTIKVHRARVMQKMGAANITDLVRMADNLGIKLSEPE